MTESRLDERVSDVTIAEVQEIKFGGIPECGCAIGGKMEAAQSKFVSLLGSISQEEKLPFLQWVKEHYTSMIEPDDRPETKSDRLLSEIVDFLKKRVPKEGLAPGEVVTNMHDVSLP